MFRLKSPNRSPWRLESHLFPSGRVGLLIQTGSSFTARPVLGLSQLVQRARIVEPRKRSSHLRDRSTPLNASLFLVVRKALLEGHLLPHIRLRTTLTFTRSLLCRVRVVCSTSGTRGDHRRHVVLLRTPLRSEAHRTRRLKSLYRSPRRLESHLFPSGWVSLLKQTGSSLAVRPVPGLSRLAQRARIVEPRQRISPMRNRSTPLSAFLFLVVRTVLLEGHLLQLEAVCSWDRCLEWLYAQARPLCCSNPLIAR